MIEWERNSRMAEVYRERYKPGTRLMLLSMEDPFAPIAPGTKGTVVHVDDQAQIHMRWDNGRTLAIIPGEDGFRELTAQEFEEELNAKITSNKDTFTIGM